MNLQNIIPSFQAPQIQAVLDLGYSEIIVLDAVYCNKTSNNRNFMFQCLLEDELDGQVSCDLWVVVKDNGDLTVDF